MARHDEAGYLIPVPRLDSLRIDRIRNPHVKLRYGHVCATVAVLLLIGMSAAYAQINPFRSSRQASGLSKEDVAMVTEATGRLNHKDPVHVGDAEDWSNPASGNSGKVTVTRLFKYAGMACHGVRYDLSYKAPRSARSYDANWCRTKAGEWKLKS
jgi:surface antigen